MAMRPFDMWLLRDHYKENAEVQQAFYRNLKFDPGGVAETIADKLYDWMTVYVAHTGQAHIMNYPIEEAKTIVRNLQEHFAEELSAITEE